jgi:hypothetical protein
MNHVHIIQKTPLVSEVVNNSYIENKKIFIYLIFIYLYYIFEKIIVVIQNNIDLVRNLKKEDIIFK